jgi:hypothetical protein
MSTASSLGADLDNNSMTDVQVPVSLSWLAPIEVEDLIRVGGSSDGGYVIPEALLREADVLISMGLGYNWQFEKDARVLNPAIRVHVYDHTVSEKLFNKEYIAEVAALLTGKVGRANVQRRRRRVRDYRAWFGKEATHFRERIHDRQDTQSVDIATVFARAGVGRVFVKMDIEGTEYRVLEDVVSYADRILGLAIEFHDTGPLRPVFERTMEVVRQRFEIVHVHANNFVALYRDGFPEALEITVARKDLVRGTRRRKALPLPELDRPNDPGRPDYRLTFA